MHVRACVFVFACMGWVGRCWCVQARAPTTTLAPSHSIAPQVFDKTPLIVTDYPKDIKAFYMRANDDGRTVAAMDLLVPK